MTLVDQSALERAVLEALRRAGRPLTVTALVELLGQRRLVGRAVVELASRGELKRRRNGWQAAGLAESGHGRHRRTDR